MYNFYREHFDSLRLVAKNDIAIKITMISYGYQKCYIKTISTIASARTACLVMQMVIRGI